MLMFPELPYHEALLPEAVNNQAGVWMPLFQVSSRLYWLLARQTCESTLSM